MMDKRLINESPKSDYEQAAVIKAIEGNRLSISEVAFLLDLNFSDLIIEYELTYSQASNVQNSLRREVHRINAVKSSFGDGESVEYMSRAAGGFAPLTEARKFELRNAVIKAMRRLT
tara:strand:- start:524 stop:874 length:351 start_codon:yes stop_codon:yes gene_type:complete